MQPNKSKGSKSWNTVFYNLVGSVYRAVNNSDIFWRLLLKNDDVADDDDDEQGTIMVMMIIDQRLF